MNMHKIHKIFTTYKKSQKVNLGIFIFWKLNEWRRFVAYAWNAG